MKNFVVIPLLLIWSVGCQDPQPNQTNEVFLASWDTLTVEGIAFLRITGTNGIQAALPSRGDGYGLSLRQSEAILQTNNLFDHEKLYDTLVAAGVSESELRAADVLAWDLHARSQGIPLHQLIGTQRTSVIRYGDARWRKDDTPASYAEKVKNLKLRAVKLHIPGASPPQHFAPDHHRLTVPEVIRYLKTVREMNPDLVLAYDPEPQIADFVLG